jgi:hypothetical protein
VPGAGRRSRWFRHSAGHFPNWSRQRSIPSGAIRRHCSTHSQMTGLKPERRWGADGDCQEPGGVGGGQAVVPDDGGRVPEAGLPRDVQPAVELGDPVVDPGWAALGLKRRAMSWAAPEAGLR